MASPLRSMGRTLLGAAAVLVVGPAILAVALLAWSQGDPEPFFDAAGKTVPGSISEKLRVRIGGVEQGMFLRGRDRTRPVLLFLHGGPGMPEYAIAQRYPRVLEEDFVVAWWEQRGSGLSYRADAAPDTITTERLIEDTLEVSRYLAERFGREKIYLLAHSGGTFPGIQAAARAPALYHAYVGVAQIANQLESERRARRYMLEEYARQGDEGMVRKLEVFPLEQLDTMPAAYRSLRDEAMHGLGIGTTHAMRSVVTGIFLPVMLSRQYTLGEKLDVWRGKWSPASTGLWNEILATDLTAKVSKLDVPVYFLHGGYDYTVSYDLAKRYFETLQAPVKGFYTFDRSAHSPPFEEPERLQRIVREDVLAGTVHLADANQPDPQAGR
jgi:pimeloyl-ACP methyl ester carboxylesterase